MDSDRLNRWLTLGANLGVLVGIILLIVELDQNRDMMRAQTRHELAMGIVDLLQIPAANEQLADLMYRAQSGEELTPRELFQFRLRTNALFRYWENVHYQYRVGLYDEIEFARQRDAWQASLTNSTLGRSYWCEVRTLYSPEFMSEMDGLLSNHPCQSKRGPSRQSNEKSMGQNEVMEFATRYAAAWSGQDPAAFASFYADNGSLTVNDGKPSLGRDAVEQTARGFMTAFPDMVVRMVEIRQEGDRVIFHWHWTGTNIGPGGTGNAVDLRGYEAWTIDSDGLILESLGHYDEAEYQRQLGAGTKGD